MMYNQAGQKELKTNIFTGVPYNANNSLEYREINTIYNETNSIINIAGDQCFGCWFFIRIVVVDPSATTYQLTVSENSESGGPAAIKAGNFQQIYILSNLFQQRKFLLDSMDNFILEATCVSGAVDMFIGLDPDSLGPDNYLWKVKSQGGVATLSIKTTDANFHMATYYYVTMQANSFQDTLLNLNLQQQRSVEFIPNNHDSTYSLTHGEFNDQILYEKYQFQSNAEHVKFHVFQVPGASKDSSGNLQDVFYRTTININALTDHFYPMIYLKKIELQTQPTELSQLSFPTIDDYYIAFGEDPFGQLYSNSFEYTFFNYSSELYTYYTMAIYSNNWGMSEHRKSEYQIKVEADVVGLCDVVDCNPQVEPSQIVQSTEKFVLSEKIEEDGSIWKWIDIEAKATEEKIIQEAWEAEQATIAATEEAARVTREAEVAAIAAAEEAAWEAEKAAWDAEQAVIAAAEEAAWEAEEAAK